MSALALLLVAAMNLAGPGWVGPAHVAQARGVSIQLGAIENSANGVVVPIVLTSPVERVAALQFAIDHADSGAPLACEISSVTPGLAGSCRVGPDDTRFSIFTLQGLDPGTSDLGLLVIESAAHAPVNVRLSTAVDPGGSRLQATAPAEPVAEAPISAAAPAPASPEPSAVTGVATPAPAVPAIAGDDASAGTTPPSSAIGAGVPPVTLEAPAAPAAPTVTAVEPEPVPASPVAPALPEAPVSSAVATVEPVERRMISFVGPQRGVVRGSPWGFRSSASAPIAVVVPQGRGSLGASAELQAGATAILSGCLLAGGVLVANRRIEPDEGMEP